MQVVIPEMILKEDLKFPIRTKKCKLILSHAAYDLTNGFYNDTENVVIDIVYNDQDPKFPAFSTIFDLHPGCFSVVSISVQFIETTFIGDNFINDKDFNPVAILSCYIVDGIADKSITENWHEMNFKNYQMPQLLPPAAIE
ncbi:MAG: hypothetical protein V4687_13470 [Bacteroidota bacterium]